MHTRAYTVSVGNTVNNVCLFSISQIICYFDSVFVC